MFKFSGDKIGMEKDDKQLLGAAAVIGGIMAAGSPKGQKLIGKGIKKIKDYTSKAAPVTKPKPPKGPYKPGKNPYSDYEQNIMGHKIVDDEKKIKFQAWNKKYTGPNAKDPRYSDEALDAYNAKMRAYKAKKFNKLNMQEEFDRITKKSFLKKLGEAMTPQVQAAAGKYLLTQLENNYTDWPFPSFKKKYGE